MHKITYCLLYGICYAISLLPFKVLYLLSDALYAVMYHLIRYRRGIVRSNLSSSFPEKEEQEIVAIEKKFYHWFCDYFMEALKLLSISEAKLRRHLVITNSDEIEATFQEGQDVAAFLGHYCNWEWLTCVGIGLPKNRIVGLVYHPLYNQAFEKLFRKIRSSVGGVPIPKKDILRYLLDYNEKGIRSIFGYVVDQGPKWENIHLWLPFLNHDTPVFTGAERIVRKRKQAVYYMEMIREKRGKYVCTYHLITKEPQELGEYEVTRRVFELLEQTICRQPEFYLWSHNRWKRTHEEFDRRFEVVNGKVLPRKAEQQPAASNPNE